MNAYDRQLQVAIEHLDNINPMFDFDGADRATQARQLKTWWGRPLADDHLHGHDPSGPIAAPGEQLTDRQLVLLSALQRGARNAAGTCAMTAEPAEGDGLILTVSGHGLAVSAKLGEGRNGILVSGIDNAVGGRPSEWFPVLIYQGGYMESPAAELADLLALSAAFDSSLLPDTAAVVCRTSYDTFEIGDDEVTIDWRTRTAKMGEDAYGALTSATGKPGAEVQEALDAVLRTAVEYGHTVPTEAISAAPAPTHGPGHSNAGAAILAGLGINVGSAKVVAIPPGGSMSIEVSAGPDGLSIAERQAFPVAVSDPEEAFMSEIATSLGIPVETFRDIIKGDGTEQDA